MMIEDQYPHFPFELNHNPNLQFVDTILYLDEHGQHQDRGQKVLGTLGGVLINLYDEKEILSFVEKIWNKYNNDLPTYYKEKSKYRDLCLSGSVLPNEALIEIANFVKEKNWFITAVTLFRSDKEFSHTQFLSDAKNIPEEMEDILRSDIKFDLRFTKQIRESKIRMNHQLDQLSNLGENVTYWLFNLIAVFNQIGGYFSSHNVFPRIRMVFDKKLNMIPQKDFSEILNFLLSQSYYSFYSNSFNQTAAVLSTLVPDYNFNFEFAESEDKIEKGIQLADICLWAWTVSQFHNTSAEYLHNATNIAGCNQFREIVEPDYLQARKIRLSEFGITTND